MKQQSINPEFILLFVIKNKGKEQPYIQMYH